MRGLFNWKSALKGYPWSIYVLQNGKELIAIAHTDRPMAALGFLGLAFTHYGDPKPPFSIGLNYNHKHTFIPLTASDFDAQGSPKSELLDKISGADAEVVSRRPLTRAFLPEFREASSKRRIETSVVMDKLFEPARRTI